MGLFSRFKFKKEAEPAAEEKVKQEPVQTGNKKVYRAIIACGSGVATSTMARKKIEKGFEERGLAIDVTQCKIGELEGLSKSYKPDFVIHTVVLPQGLHFDCPVFSGVPFLTGVGMKKTLDDIVAAIKKD